MSQVLKTLVHITANGWLTLWLSFTVFLSVTRFLQSAWGWESNVARAVVYAGAQGTLLLTTMWLDSFLTRIRDNLCPRLSEQAHTILQEHEQGAANTGAQEAAGGVGEVDGRAWNSRLLLKEPAYMSLPDAEPPNAMRDKIRKALGLRAPRNRHEQLFGILGTH